MAGPRGLPAPSPWPAGSLSGLTAGRSREEGQLTWLHQALQRKTWRGGKGESCVLMGSRGWGQQPGRLGHRQQRSLAPLAPFTAAKEAASMPHRQPLPAPQRAAAQGEATFPAERKERQEQNQSGLEEREAEKARRNWRARPSLAPPMGSVAAQRQVTISKPGPCSLGLVGGGKGRRSPRELRGCLPRQRRWLHPFPGFPEHEPSAEVPPTRLLGNLSVECSPQTLGCWERGRA